MYAFITQLFAGHTTTLRHGEEEQEKGHPLPTADFFSELVTIWQQSTEKFPIDQEIVNHQLPPVVELSGTPGMTLTDKLLPLLGIFVEQPERSTSAEEVTEQLSHWIQSNGENIPLPMDGNDQQRSLIQDLAAMLHPLPVQEQKAIIRQLAQLIVTALGDNHFLSSLVQGIREETFEKANPASDAQTHMKTVSEQEGRDGRHSEKRLGARPRGAPLAPPTPPRPQPLGGDPIERHPLVLDRGTEEGGIRAGTQTTNGELVEIAESRHGSAPQMRTAPPPATPVLSSVTTPSSGTPVTPWLLDANHLVRQLRMTPEGISHARLSLYPEHLGQVDVRITNQNGVLTAQLVTDTWLAKQLLEGHLDQLRQALQSQGMQINKLEVSIGEQGSMTRHFQQRQEGEQEHLLHQREAASTVAAQDVHDHYELTGMEAWRHPHASINYTV